MNNLRGKITDFEKLALFADSPEPGKRARMQFGGRDGMFRITVFTGVGTEGKDGIIYCPFDPGSFSILLNMLEQAIRAEPGEKFKVVCRGTIYENDKPTDKTKLLGEVYVGKNSEGIVWISMTHEKHPKIIFEFRTSKFMDFYGKDGNKMSDTDLSKLTAGAYLNTLRNIMSAYSMAVSCEPKPQAANSSSFKQSTTKGNDSDFDIPY